MAAIDDITITSNADAFLFALQNDLERINNREVVGSIRNDVTYGGFVNDGTSRMSGRHFVERSEPGIQAILAEEYEKIEGVPYSEKFRKANDIAMKRAIEEELRPRTPRSNQDVKPPHHYVSESVRAHLQDSYYITKSVIF